MLCLLFHRFFILANLKMAKVRVERPALNANCACFLILLFIKVYYRHIIH